jgi:hypothetical protein
VRLVNFIHCKAVVEENVKVGNSKANADAKLAKVKLALAEKCERLAKVTGSTPRQNTMKYQAARFRRQAADLTRAAELTK